MGFTGSGVSNKQNVFLFIDVFPPHQLSDQLFVDGRLALKIECIDGLHYPLNTLSARIHSLFLQIRPSFVTMKIFFLKRVSLDNQQVSVGTYRLVIVNPLGMKTRRPFLPWIPNLGHLVPKVKKFPHVHRIKTFSGLLCEIRR